MSGPKEVAGVFARPCRSKCTLACSFTCVWAQYHTCASSSRSCACL